MVRQEVKGILVGLVNLGSVANLAPQDHVVPLVLMVLKVVLGYKDHQGNLDSLVHLDLKEFLVWMEVQGHLALKERQVIQESKESLGSKAPQEQRERKVPGGHRERKEILAFQVCRGAYHQLLI